MLPIVFEWHWDIGHFIFMGLFYLALTVVGLGLMATLAMTFRDLYSGVDPHQDGHGEEHEEGEAEATH